MLQELQRGMTSNTIRGIRRKKSTLTEVKVAVIGAPGVGKSALTVRFLTKRYIGEYDHQADMRYKHEVLVDGEPILFEILDSCPKTEDDIPSNEILNWADGCLLVYAITDRISFNYVRKVKELLCDIPVALVGNKGDMVHLRQVSTDEGEILAKDYECWFSEVAAAEQVSQIAEAFNELCREILSVRRRNKQSLLDRMLGGKSSVKVYARGKSDSALPKE
ncbi:ras-related and estrogen-regulated growth inhibitor isoform X2 [Halyomorpha halys]